MSASSDPKAGKARAAPAAHEAPKRTRTPRTSRDGAEHPGAGRTASAREEAGSGARSARAAGEGGGFFPDLLRRGLTLGFTGVFMTEEAVRRALGEAAPRELVETLLAQSERTRAELLDRFSRELGRVLGGLDPAEVARRLLEGRTVEVEARFRLVPEGERARRGAGADAGAERAAAAAATGADGEDGKEDEAAETGAPEDAPQPGRGAHGRR